MQVLGAQAGRVKGRDDPVAATLFPGGRPLNFDPSEIAGADPDAGLANRNMLLQARFGPLRFELACRVGALTDETRDVDGCEARVRGWSYGTLEGRRRR